MGNLCIGHCFPKKTFDRLDEDSMGAGVVKPQPDGRGGIRIHINPGNNRTPPSFGHRQYDTSSNHGHRSQSKPESTSCEECGQNFTPFRKKKQCKDCSRNFCSNCCVSAGSSSPRLVQCKKCQILLTGTFSRSLLAGWKVKDLKALLNKQNVNTSKCKEKEDLIELIFIYFGGNPNYNRQTSEQERFVEQLAERMRQEQLSEQQSSNSQNRPGDTSRQTTEASTHREQGIPASNTHVNLGTSDNRGRDSSRGPAGSANDRPDSDQDRLQRRREQEMREAEARLRAELELEHGTSLQQQDNPNIKLNDLKSVEEIEELNIKDLKRLLLNNFVDYKGCCERWELQDRVKRLWIDNENNKKKAEEVRKMTDDPTAVPSTSTSTEDDICKICMDAAIDCVLLECGHMVTCTQCGKRLSECPICRQYVVRAVHTFRS